MPKSNFLRKKSKTGATADFKRLKAKVGKRAPQAASHTDTSFKSKRVKVSAQSILHELGDGDAVTARGQGVQELLVQLRHYSPASKREALAGLKSVVDRHRAFAEVNFARLAEASLELAVCPDSEVRKALLTFQEALLGCVSPRTFSPFASLYMAYVVSAMTSLEGGIRRDSISLLALLLARFPAAVAERAARLAPNYLTLLTVDPASKKQAGRAAALKSLVSLFRAVSLRHGSNGGGGGSLVGAGGRVDGRISGGCSSGSVHFSWKRGSRRNSALVLCACATPGTGIPGSDGGGGGEGSRSEKTEAPATALASILPQMLERLREVWIEALAAVPPDIVMMQSVVDLLLEVVPSPAWVAQGGCDGGESGGVGRLPAASTARRDEATTGGKGPRTGSCQEREGSRVGGCGGGPSAWLSRFVPLVLETFPVRPLEGELLGDAEADRLLAIQGLNMGLCELVVAACTGPAATARAGRGEGAKGSSEGEDSSDWLAPVLAHVHEVLRDGVGKSGAAGALNMSVLRVLCAATLNQTGKANVSASWTTQRQQLLSAFGDFLESLPSKAESKLLCVKAVCNLTGTLLSGSATRGQTAMSDPEAAREVRRWLQLLPELLCQWGGEFPESSAAALRALVEVAKLAPSPAAAVAGTPGASRGGGQARGKTAIAAGEAAAGGGGGGGAWAMESSELLRSIKPELLGEFLSGRGFPTLQAEAQMDAISLLYHLPSIPACVVTALAAACSEPNTLHGDVRSFALEVIHHRRRSLTPSAYLGFLVSVLTGFTGGKHIGGAKRTARTAGGIGAGEHGGGGKRRRQKSAADRGGVQHEETAQSPPAPLTLWETVFRRDAVTGAVCNSLAMIGTRGGALLEALRPTLLQLLREGNSGRRGAAGTATETSGDGGGGAAVSQSLDEDSLATTLQRQRAAMACVLCCWDGLDGLDVEPSTVATAASTAATAAPQSESPLSALEGPMAVASVRAMEAAGRVEAAEQSRGARLLRPVLVLVKRWPALLPLILSRIVDATADATVAGEGGVVPGGEFGVRSMEPLLRCLMVVVRDPGLQGQLRRRHLGMLRSTSRMLCGALERSPLKDVVVQLRADVELLGGGLTEDGN